MEIRDFFTDKEIEKMKERIIEQAGLYAFIVQEERDDEDGPYKAHVLEYKIREAVQEETVKLVKDYVKKIIEATVKERVTDAVNKFTQNLVDQLTKITEKTSWHWSIK